MLQFIVIIKKHIFKNADKTFTLKTTMSRNSFNTIFVSICSSCLEECIGETGVEKTRLRDGIRVHRQHIKQPEHQQLTAKEHIRVCGIGSFKIFPFFQMRSNDANLTSKPAKLSIKENIKLHLINSDR